MVSSREAWHQAPSVDRVISRPYCLRVHCEAEPSVSYPLLNRLAALLAERLDETHQTRLEPGNPPGFAEPVKPSGSLAAGGFPAPAQAV